MRFGGPVFIDTQEIAAFISKHKEKGFRACYCPGWLTPTSSDAQFSEAAQALAEADIVAAEVGAWCNCLDPNPEVRERNISYVIGQLQVAERLGARCCVDYSGSFSPDHPAGPHVDDLSQRAFDEVVANTQRIIDAVNPQRTYFTLEMMQWAWPDSPDAYLDVMRAVDRPAFAVHLDAVNVIASPRSYYHNADVVRECVTKLGPHIRSAHAKDCTMSDEYLVHIRECMMGEGHMDYVTVLRGLDGLEDDVPLMLEHLASEAEYDQAAAHVRRVAEEAGVRL